MIKTKWSVIVCTKIWTCWDVHAFSFQASGGKFLMFLPCKADSIRVQISMICARALQVPWRLGTGVLWGGVAAHVGCMRHSVLGKCNLQINSSRPGGAMIYVWKLDKLIFSAWVSNICIKPWIGLQMFINCVCHNSVKSVANPAPSKPANEVSNQRTNALRTPTIPASARRRVLDAWSKHAMSQECRSKKGEQLKRGTYKTWSGTQDDVLQDAQRQPI